MHHTEDDGVSGGGKGRQEAGRGDSYHPDPRASPCYHDNCLIDIAARAARRRGDPYYRALSRYSLLASSFLRPAHIERQLQDFWLVPGPSQPSKKGCLLGAEKGERGESSRQ